MQEQFILSQICIWEKELKDNLNNFANQEVSKQSRHDIWSRTALPEYGHLVPFQMPSGSEISAENMLIWPGANGLETCVVLDGQLGGQVSKNHLKQFQCSYI